MNMLAAFTLALTVLAAPPSKGERKEVGMLTRDTFDVCILQLHARNPGATGMAVINYDIAPSGVASVRGVTLEGMRPDEKFQECLADTVQRTAFEQSRHGLPDAKYRLHF